MICPVCKTNIAENANTEFCTQCGSDIKVHRLLEKIQREVTVDCVQTISDSAKPDKSKCLTLLLLSHVVLTFFLSILIILSIFIGYRVFVSFKTHESHRITTLSQWSETGFKQLRDMNKMIKQELDLIIVQRNENQRLHSKITILTVQLSSIKQQQEHQWVTNQRQKNDTLQRKIEMLNAKILRLINKIPVSSIDNMRLPRP